ncbi:MAG: TetR/AcrR family transcriptional regulator [Bacteroidales bacterium]|jgi:AcrR family transcriptional regulator|nr:TetR/AcrR family transcriptional regulator [Bacteroidales bacterium]
MTARLEIRDQIIETASRIFSKYGFRKTTMDEIARVMGKGKSSIYYYFKNKEEIYEAVIDRETEILRRELVRAISQADTPQEKLRRFVEVRMRIFSKLSNVYNAIRTEVVAHLASIEKFRQKYDREEIHMLQDILQEGVDKGVFRIEDTLLTATAIVTALKGLEVPLFWSGVRKDTEERMNDLLNVLFYGILNR